jgi:hypothetical protein
MTEGRVDAVSRRVVLTTGLRVLAVAGALTTVEVVESNAQQKMAQKLVQYQLTPKKDQKCSICLHFVPPDGCKLVEGKINPEGWCALYAPKPKTK